MSAYIEKRMISLWVRSKSIRDRGNGEYGDIPGTNVLWRRVFLLFSLLDSHLLHRIIQGKGIVINRC